MDSANEAGHSSKSSASSSNLEFIGFGGSSSATPQSNNSKKPSKRKLSETVEKERERKIKIEYSFNPGSEEDDESDSEDDSLAPISRSAWGCLREEDERDLRVPAPVSEVDFGPKRYEFKWEKIPKKKILPKDRQEKFTGEPGPTVNFQNPFEAFKAIWDLRIMQEVVDQTNLYADKTISSMKLSKASHLRQWTPTNVDELYTYFGVLLSMGLCTKTDLVDYWTQDGAIYDTPNYNYIMTYERFQLLNKFLHFSSVDTSNFTAQQSKISKIAPIIEHLNSKF